MTENHGADVTVNTVSRNTEIGRAERFVKSIEKTHRFVPETREWHVCQHGIWRRTDEKQVLDAAFTFIKEDAQRIAGIADLRDREEAILDYRRYANQSEIHDYTFQKNLSFPPIHFSQHLPIQYRYYFLFVMLYMYRQKIYYRPHAHLKYSLLSLNSSQQDQALKIALAKMHYAKKININNKIDVEDIISISIKFKNEISGDKEEWCFVDGLGDYLSTELGEGTYVPGEPIIGEFNDDETALSWAVIWERGDRESINESYVNLIPTLQGGTHVSGMRTGITDAIKEFCDYRKLLPKGVKLTPDDVWKNCSYILSAKLKDPQFTGQTKEKLSSKDFQNIATSITKDSFSIWLNQETQAAEEIAFL